jgi:hypothetical protein
MVDGMSAGYPNREDGESHFSSSTNYEQALQAIFHREEMPTKRFWWASLPL